MKLKLLTLFALITLTGCSLIFGAPPKSTVTKFLEAAKKGDTAAMNQLFSAKAKQNLGAGKIIDNNRRFAEVSQRKHQNATYNMEEVEELIEGKEASVSFLYRTTDGKDSVGLKFELSKEGRTWKIDNIGPRPEKGLSGARSSVEGSSETPSPFPSVEYPSELPSYSPPVSSISEAEPPPPPPPKPTATTRPPISGGVLNAKAISLPSPAYSPAAKAVKARGTVVVQVTVDEQGNVISASPVSGHPLLQAAATAAARQAKFSPTKLSGQPVKVTGVITYNFPGE